MPKKQLENPFIKPQRSKTPKHPRYNLTSTVVSARTKKTINLPRLVNSTIEDNITKDVRNLFRLKKENKAIKDRIIRGIRTLFESEEEDYYKPPRISNIYSNNLIEYETKGDKDKTLSIIKYLERT